MQAEIKSSRFVECDCGKHQFDIEHILTGSNFVDGFLAVWSCPQCGQSWKLTIDQKNETVVMEKQGKPFITHVLLRQDTAHSPIWLILKELYWTPKNLRDGDLPYYYNEHTCPTNFIRGIEVIVQDGDDDPHGLFQFVRAVTDEQFETAVAVHGNEDAYRNLFPEAYVKVTATEVTLH